MPSHRRLLGLDIDACAFGKRSGNLVRPGGLVIYSFEFQHAV